MTETPDPTEFQPSEEPAEDYAGDTADEVVGPDDVEGEPSLEVPD